MRPLLLLLTLALLAGSGCKKKEETTAAFYFWKTRYALNSTERQTMQVLGARKLYLRFFDVDWNNQRAALLPRATVNIADSVHGNLEMVPVVFITQRSLPHITDSITAKNLAANIAHLVEALCAQTHAAPREIQLDCDWTARTREHYFMLLRSLRENEFFRGKILSVTIRMHQVKYVGSSGIPPADRGMLMCYNMGNTRKPGAHNSILDADEAEDYLDNIESYPLPLDIALPLFRWCLLFREGKLLGILRDVSPEEVATVNFLETENKILFHCKKDTSWRGYNLKRGDVIRAETPSAKDIRRIARFTASRLPAAKRSVALYHLDSLTCSKFSANELESFFAPFR